MEFHSIYAGININYEQKMVLAAYATQHEDSTMQFDDIARNIISALKPVEKITKIISTSFACISAVIPVMKRAF